MSAKTEGWKSDAGRGRARQGQMALWLGADACVQVPAACLQLKAQDCKTDVRIQLWLRPQHLQPSSLTDTDRNLPRYSLPPQLTDTQGPGSLL